MIITAEGPALQWRVSRERLLSQCVPGKTWRCAMLGSQP